MKSNFVVAVAIFLVGCGPDPDINMQLNKQSNVVVTPTSPRFSITQVGAFDDNIAYGGKRGVYIITDSLTGKEYVGVSGVGIAETGSHTQMVGKVATSVQDER